MGILGTTKSVLSIVPLTNKPRLLDLPKLFVTAEAVVPTSGISDNLKVTK